MSWKLPQCLFGRVQRYPSSFVNYLSDGWDAMHHPLRQRFIPADSWRKHNVGPKCRDEPGLRGVALATWLYDGTDPSDINHSRPHLW